MMISSQLIAKERDEQIAFVEWLELKNLKFTATAHSTYTPYKKQLVNNWLMGLRRGFPDMIVIIPKEKSVDGTARLLFLEMKRKKKYDIKEEQVKWIECLNHVDNVHAKIVFGADQAIEMVSHFLKS